MSSDASESGGQRTLPLGPTLYASAVAIAVLYAGSLPMHSNDFHIFAAMGRWMVEHGQLLEREVFTWTADGVAFVHGTWGFSLGSYLLHEAIGLDGLRLLNGVVVGSTVALAGLAARGRGTDWRGAGIAALYAWWGVLQNGVVRGQTWVYPLFCLLMWQGPRARRPLLFGTLLGAVWAPLHGSFPAGIAWAGLTGQLRLAAGLAIGVCLGPYGPGLWSFVLSNTSKPAARGFTEWLPPTLGEVEGARFWLVVAVWAVVLLWRRKLRLQDALVMGAFGLLAMRSTRFVAWFMLATAPVAAVTAQDLWGREQGLNARLVKLANAVLAALWSMMLFRGLQAPDTPLHKETPVALVAALGADASRGRVLQPPEWGGLVVFELGEDFEIVSDIRGWIFDDDAWAVWFETASAVEGWEDTLDDAGVSHVLLTEACPLEDALDAHPSWERLAEDETGALWRRVGSLAAPGASDSDPP